MSPLKIIRSEKFMDYAIIAGITLLFLAMIILNVNLIFKMTSNQTEEIGRMQLENIRNELETKILNSENATRQIANETEKLIAEGATVEQLENFFKNKKREQREVFKDVCFNVYMSNREIDIIPDTNLPEGYHGADRLWYKGAAGNFGIYITEPYMDAAGNGICFTMSTMLSDRNTVVAMDFNFSDIQEYILKMISTRGRNALIVTRDGMIIGYNDMSLVGEKISDELPQYEKILDSAIRNRSHRSFNEQINGEDFTIFSNETKNDWYMILSVDNWAFYSDSYRQMVLTICISLLMLAVIIFFYINGVKNRTRAEKALNAKEEFLSHISQGLREPLQRILKISKAENLESGVSASELAAQVQESALQLSEMMNNLFSFSKIATDDLSIEEDKNRGMQLSKVSKIARVGIIGILIIAMAVSMVLCGITTIELGDMKMQRAADTYEYQMTDWVEHQKGILRIFVSLISEHPELMDNYPNAVKFLNDIAKIYPEISVCYMANPNDEHVVIMNNGWLPPEDFKLEDRPWYIDTINSEQKFSISAPYYDAQTGLYCITLSQAVYNKQGEFLGVFGVDFFLDKLIHILDESYTTDGYAFLVDKDELIINHPNRKYQMNTKTSTLINETEYASIYRNAGKIFPVKDYKDMYVVCLAQKNQDSNFTIVVASSWFSIYGNILTLGVLFIFLLMISVIAVAMLINRQLNWQQSVNQKLQEAADTANRANQAKFQFLAQMSHEIRTPLNAILGMNELILRESQENDTIEYSENIQSAGKTLLSLINTILDFSKLDSGKMQIVPVRYNTLNMIDELLTMANERAQKKDLSFIVEIDSKLPKTLYGDDMRIKQVITNILTNAIKYTPSGYVKLEMILNYIDDENLVEFQVRVSDTGIGIKAEDMDKLFKSFIRLDEERNRNIEGTGLGIAIVQKLLVMMGSDLKVESVYGEGSTFYFNLKQKIIDKTPIGNFKEHNAAGKIAADKKNKQYLKFPNAKILVVDDNQMNLKVIRGIMKFNAITPDLADSGKKCLELVAQNHYQIIFLDHMMPEMDGIETLKRLRDEHLADNTLIIALTANAVSGAREFYIKHGFNDYLSKPVNPDELELTLKKYLPEENPEIATPAKIETVEEILPNEENAKVEETDDDTLTRKDLKLLQEICLQINPDAAMSYCMNSKDFFVEMLQEFCEDDKTESINNSYAAEDWKNYRILVHALKSTSMVIGALHFSDNAKAQEFAAKENRIDDLKNNHADFMNDYEKLRANISQWLEVSGNAKNIDS